MPKVLLKRNQFDQKHVFHHAGEIDVTDEVAAEFKKRGVLGELPAPSVDAPTPPSKPVIPGVKN